MKKFYIGTSGYSYQAWKGSFYPRTLASSAMLDFYAHVFNAVEINSTFYALPKADQIKAWAMNTPPGFQFALKVHQGISHQKRLHQVGADLATFSDLTQGLGVKRGPLLIQLPPFFKMDLQRLREVLRHAPASARLAFEFRHPSWFTPEIFDTLHKAGAALCVADTEKLSTPWQATTVWGYLRLRREDYTSADLASWAEKAKREKLWKQVYVFFKHEEKGKGPAFAANFLQALKSDKQSF